MTNDELKKIWKSSSQVEKVKFEKSRLILEMQSSIENVNKKIKSRDIMETVASLIVIPTFTYYAFIMPYLSTKIASILIVIWAFYVIFHLRRIRKLKPSEYTDNYLTYLKKNKDYLQNQKKVLDTVLWWYIAPFLFCLGLFVIGFLGVPGKENWIIKTLLIGVIISLIIYFTSKKYSRKEYESRIHKIEDLIKVIESNDL